MLPPESTATARLAWTRPGEEGRQPHGAGAFDDGLGALKELHDRHPDLGVGDRDDIVNVLAHEAEGDLARVLDGDPVGDRLGLGGRVDLAVLERRDVRRAPGGLDADHADVRPLALDRKRDPREQATASERDDDGVDVRNVFEDLEADRALPGDHELVVERVDERAAVGGGVGDGRRNRVLDRVAHQADGRAVALGRPDLRERCRLGHVHRRRHAGRAGGECDRLGVVPGRWGDDARDPLRIGQRADLVIGAADLERAGLLAVLELEEDVARALARERLRPLGGRAVGDAPQRIGRGPDVVEGRHGSRRTVPRLHRPSDLG